MLTFSNKKSKIFRRRAEVYIKNGDKIFVGITNSKEKYIIPGGEIEKNESPINAAKREALEEIGISTKNLKHISTKKIDIKDSNKYDGEITYSFIGEFDKKDKSLWGKEPDSFKYKQVDINELINFFTEYSSEYKKQNDLFNYNRLMYILLILKNIGGW